MPPLTAATAGDTAAGRPAPTAPPAWPDEPAPAVAEAVEPPAAGPAVPGWPAAWPAPGAAACWLPDVATFEVLFGFPGSTTMISAMAATRMMKGRYRVKPLARSPSVTSLRLLMCLPPSRAHRRRWRDAVPWFGFSRRRLPGCSHPIARLPPARSRGTTPPPA